MSSHIYHLFDHAPSGSSRAIIWTPDNEVLTLTRWQGAKLRAGGLDLPGGKADFGEDIKTTAIRETREETGLGLRRVDGKWVYSVCDRDAATCFQRFYLLFTREVDLTTVTLQSNEHSQAQLMPYEQAMVEYPLAADRAALGAAACFMLPSLHT